MYEHHKQAIEALKKLYEPQPGVIALVLDGSVARGRERPDSDIDAIVVVTEEYYAKKRAEGHLAECIHGHCNYEGGYFDVKYFTVAQVNKAATHGNEPHRCALVGSRLLFSRDEAVTAALAAIPVFQTGEVEEKMLAFAANLMMNHGYFWPLRHESLYLQTLAATQIVYSAYRMVLQEKHILFPCNRELEETVEAIGGDAAQLVALGRRFLTQFDDESEKAFVAATLAYLDYTLPEDGTKLQSTYVSFFEMWWHEPRPFIGEW